MLGNISVWLSFNEFVTFKGSSSRTVGHVENKKPSVCNVLDNISVTQQMSARRYRHYVQI